MDFCGDKNTLLLPLSILCWKPQTEFRYFLCRLRQENDMVDSAPQWEAVLRRQKEKTQADPNYRRSRHRSRSYVPLDHSDMKTKATAVC